MVGWLTNGRGGFADISEGRVYSRRLGDEEVAQRSSSCVMINRDAPFAVVEDDYTEFQTPALVHVAAGF